MLMDTPTWAATAGKVTAASAAAKNKRFMLDLLWRSSCRWITAYDETNRTPPTTLCADAHSVFSWIGGHVRRGGSMQNGPRGPQCTACCVESLCPGLPQIVDGHGWPWRRGRAAARRLGAGPV